MMLRSAHNLTIGFSAGSISFRTQNGKADMDHMGKAGISFTSCSGGTIAGPHYLAVRYKLRLSSIRESCQNGGIFAIAAGFDFPGLPRRLKDPVSRSLLYARCFHSSPESSRFLSSPDRGHLGRNRPPRMAGLPGTSAMPRSMERCRGRTPHEIQGKIGVSAGTSPVYQPGFGVNSASATKACLASSASCPARARFHYPRPGVRERSCHYQLLNRAGG